MATTIHDPAKPQRLPSEDELSQLAELAHVPQEKEARRYFSHFIVNMLLPELRYLVNYRSIVHVTMQYVEPCAQCIPPSRQSLIWPQKTGKYL